MRLEFTAEQGFKVMRKYADKKLETMSDEEKIKLLCEQCFALRDMTNTLMDVISEVLDVPKSLNEELRSAFVDSMERFDYDAIPEDELKHQLHVAVHNKWPMDEDEFFFECFKKAVDNA